MWRSIEIASDVWGPLLNRNAKEAETMAHRKLISLAAVGFFLSALALGTGWAQDVPATAGAFAAYCTPLKKGCATKIEAVQVGAMMESLNSAKPTTVCTVPDGIEAAAGHQAIVAWLSAHPATANLSTENGINAAIKALWNCQGSVATGVTSRGVPDKTDAFVAFCDDTKHYAKCANEVVQASINAYFAKEINDKSAHCTSPDGVETQELTIKVLAWLKGHKELYGQATEVGTAAAIDHLWPCH
jgi:hypothetical protein